MSVLELLRIGVKMVQTFPTFGPINRVKFIIAGGKKSLIKSSEGAEDNVDYAKYLVKLNKLKSST